MSALHLLRIPGRRNLAAVAAGLALVTHLACARTPTSDAQGPPVTTAHATPDPTLQRLLSTMPTPPGRAVRARVTRVIDGDTVVLAGIGAGARDRQTGGRRARLIGVDTPEVHGRTECFGREASAFTRNVLDRRDVLVDFDVAALDRFQRALVYIWELDGTFFNGRLVAEGFAAPFTVPPNVRYADAFVRWAAEAREAGRGLWSRC